MLCVTVSGNIVETHSRTQCSKLISHDKKTLVMVMVCTFFGIDSKCGFEQKGYGLVPTQEVV